MTTANTKLLEIRRGLRDELVPATSVAIRASRHRGAAGAAWRRPARIARSYGAVALFVLTWEVLARSGVIDASLVPPFSTVLATLLTGLMDPAFLGNVLISFGRAGAAFAIACALAIPLGLFMGSFRRFEELVDPLLQLFRQTAALAIYPVFILLLGLGEASKVTIIVWAAVFPLLLNTISGVKQVDRRLIEMARMFGATPAQVFRRVVLPAAIPPIFVGLRISATSALLALVAAEMIGAKQGIGFMIINAQYNFQIPLMFAAIVLLALIGVASNAALLALQARLCRWDVASAARAASPDNP